jgi:uncharacterized protein
VAVFVPTVRTFHLVASMLAAVALLFIATTGVLLNHAKKLKLDEADPVIVQATVPLELLEKPDADALEAFLRRDRVIPGTREVFEADEDCPVRLVFRAPGCVTDVSIQREDGQAEIQTTSYGTIGVLSDLHRGKNSGDRWHHLLDVAALFLALSALTGIALGFSLPKRRLLTLIFLLLGAAGAVGAYLYLVAW